jgi:hypothetical protein
VTHIEIYLARADPKLVELHPFNRDTVVKLEPLSWASISKQFSESQLHPFLQTEIHPTGDLEGRESGVGDLRVVSSVSSSDRWAVDLLSSERIYAALVGVNDHVCEDAFKSCALEDEWREGGG